MTRTNGKFGPGLLVTAAFIGPGTVTTASIAGAQFGFALLWALLFSVLATILLQEMASRLGLVTRQGLSEVLRSTYRDSWLGTAAILLVVAAVGIGNAAYQAGNITGAALGLQSVSGIDLHWWALAVGLFAGALLASGIYQLIEKLLIALVLLMSVVFLMTLLMVRPAPADMLAGLLLPSLPAGSLLTVLALIGTTVVPYNLFLQASAVQEKWSASVDLRQALRASRIDTGLSIGVGGLITLAIMSTSAAAFFGSGSAFSATSMAQQLEPLLGAGARYFFAAGLFAAGLSSAVTAPLAAAYAVCGVLGWSRDLRATRFRLVWAAVLLCGTAFAVAGAKPLAAILFAQAANGFLLPFCAIFLLMVMNRRQLLGAYANRPLVNILGLVVIVVTIALGVTKLVQVYRAVVPD
ncbi:MAG: Nramp family divalent metal transporter [Pseudomonadales bacterium]|nr:Nramp family divalent metal transporter [Pseudomonadales bacterium]MCP5167727.1 Nramp family divalent metal transporter [Pseudomonadales bacterium]MCP5187513.1 Nramp family divalent metal transporter [Pseudomonadales bacterium]